MKNKFMCNYDENNMHQNPDDGHNKENDALRIPALTSVKKTVNPISPPKSINSSVNHKP
jgi:hypothetical protein